MNPDIALNALAAMIRFGRDFGRMRHNESGKQPMTNWTTQLLGNRPVSASAVFTVDGEEVEVNLVNYTPSRNLETGETDKGAVSKFREVYEGQRLPEGIAVSELLRDAVYFAASISSGMLPSAKRLSAESTLKGTILKEWLESDDLGIELQSLTIRGDGDPLTYQGNHVLGLAGMFADNYDRILETHSLGGRGDDNAADGLEWDNVEAIEL